MSVVPYNDNKNDSKALVKTDGNAVITRPAERLSSLPAPLLRLTGHTGEVYSIKFNPSGSILASASHDGEVRLWNVYGDCSNFLTFKLHHNAVLDVQWSLYAGHLFTCSADHTVLSIDVEANQLTKRFTGHKSVVNAVAASRTSDYLLASASNDKTLRLWDTRLGRRSHADVIRHDYPVTAVAFSKDGNTIFSGSLDNTIRGWDVRMTSSALAAPTAAAPAYVGDAEIEPENGVSQDDNSGSVHSVKMELAGHTNTITGLEFSHDGRFLLSNAMDSRLRIWDTRPFAGANRCVKIFLGHQHSYDMSLLRCAWSVDGRFVTAGSSDGLTYVWNTTNREIVYKLAGHTGVVHDVRFHPREQIVASCSADKSILLGELKL